MGNNGGCCPTKSADKSTKGGGDGFCGITQCYATLLKGALVGGIMMFAVFMVSWTLLPWHKASIGSFAKESAVTSALTANGAKPGVYVVPKLAPIATRAPDKAPKFFAFVSVGKQGFDSDGMAGAMFKQLLLCLFGAAMLTKFLKKSAGACCPISCSMKMGLLIACFGYLPNMFWFQFPLGFSVIGMLDVIVAFTLAGAAISKIVLGECSK